MSARNFIMQEYHDHLKEHGYVLVKNFLSPDVLELCKSFLDLSMASGMRHQEINPGYLFGDVEHIEPNIFADSILLAYKNAIEAIFQTELVPSYIFVRQYHKDSSLVIHRDRPVCEFSATILIDKDGDGPSCLGFCDDEEGTNPVEVEMEEGDAIVFTGAKDFDGRWHYRPKVEQKSVTQAFLHYVSPGNRPENIFPRPIRRSQ
jgi:hypothetical protein